MRKRHCSFLALAEVYLLALQNRSSAMGQLRIITLPKMIIGTLYRPQKMGEP